jgi:hypothetical protein
MFYRDHTMLARKYSTRMYMAALVLLVAEWISMEPPGRSRGDNPDVITRFQGRDWGLACKVVHSDNPRGYRNHVIRGVEQIEAAAVDRGIVVFNLKNIVPHEVLSI